MVALITGAAKGIGKELVIGLSKKGIDIIFTYNNSLNESNKLVKYIKEHNNVNIYSFKCDLSKEEDIKNLKNEVLKKYENIDILINNAALSMDNYIDSKTKEEFMKVLEVNVVGTFLLTKYFYKNINNGIIVNISSTDSIDTYSPINIDYSVSKAGVNMLTKEFSSIFNNIKVIGVMPNWTNTESIKEMNPIFLEEELKRIGQERLEEPLDVSNNIINLIFDKTIKSGEIRRV